FYLGPCKIISSPAPVFTLIEFFIFNCQHMLAFSILPLAKQHPVLWKPLWSLPDAYPNRGMADRFMQNAIVSESQCILVTPASKTTFLPEELCIGFGICVKVGCILLQ
ncbi:unnamed protein product, partial [Brassica oleracea]